MPKSTTLYSVQYLRALAALLVLAFHQLIDVFAPFAYGNHGVDLFFVISGFIMVALTERRPASPSQFALDRVSRIVPLYWIATAITAALTAIGVTNRYVQSPGAIHLLKSLFFIPALNQTGHPWPTLFLGWTLNFEAFFYLLFALALFVRKAVRIPLMGALLLNLALWGRIFPTPQGAASMYFSPLLLEFLAGMIFGTIFGFDLGKLTRKKTMIAVGLTMFSIAALSQLFHELEYCFVSVGLLSVMLGFERLGALPKIPLLVSLGNASYSIYLLQQVAFDCTRTLVDHFSRTQNLHVPHVALGATCFVAAIILGWLVHLYIEVPTTKSVRRWSSQWTGMKRTNIGGSITEAI